MKRREATLKRGTRIRASGFVDEIRSHFVPPDASQLPSDSPPCTAPGGHSWVHAYAGPTPLLDTRHIGKWLIRVNCRYAEYCWGCVCRGTESSTLGIAAKVSTDWGRLHDPSGPWKQHVICVYTRDWRDEEDVRRVAGALRRVDAIRKQTLYYKPDVMTYSGIYSGSSAGEVAIYSCSPPYDELVRREDGWALLERVIDERQTN